MPVTKDDINNLLQHFLDETWIDESEANEIREYLHSRIDNGTLDAINLEACFDEDWGICAPSTLWETLEEVRRQNA